MHFTGYPVRHGDSRHFLWGKICSVQLDRPRNGLFLSALKHLSTSQWRKPSSQKNYTFQKQAKNSQWNFLFPTRALSLFSYFSVWGKKLCSKKGYFATEMSRNELTALEREGKKERKLKLVPIEALHRTRF